MVIKNLNKRGDAPISILVIGVIAICILTIVSFLFSNRSISEEEIGIGAFEGIYSDVEEFKFFINSGYSEEESLEKMIFDKEEDIRNGKFKAEIGSGDLVIKRNYEIWKISEAFGEPYFEMNVTYITEIN